MQFPELKVITTEEEFLKITGKNEQLYMVLLGKYVGNEDNKIENIEILENKLGLNIGKEVESDNIVRQYIYPGIIIGILVFSVIFVSLNSIVKIIINERIPEIGTFRSIGATKNQVMYMLLLELLIYSIIPSLIGGAIGVAALKCIESMLNYEMNMFGVSTEIKMIKYLVPISLITLVITVLFQMVLSVTELINVSKMSIKDTIFNKHISIYNYTIIKIIVGILFFFIGIITLLKYKQLTYWFGLIGIISIFISIALFVPTTILVFLKFFGRNKSPIIKMAINKVKTSSLQINTNIIFIVTISVSLVTYSFF